MSIKKMSSRERADQCLLPIDWALYHAAHDYPGGIAAIAAVDGTLSAATLQNKLNPNVSSHIVNIKDFRVICAITQDRRILRTVCSWFNAGFFLMPNVEVGGEALFAQGAELAKECGELMASIQESLTDGNVNADEVAMLDNALQELMTAAGTLVEVAKRAGGAGNGHH
jgi:hypothetical protein